MRNTSLFAALFLLVLACHSHAQVSGEVTITADTLSYSEDGTTLEASGSSEVISPDVKIDAPHVIYNIEERRVVADAAFAMKLRTGAILSGESLDYNFKTRTGSTKNVNISYRYAVLSGGIANIDEEKIELKDSSFNTCGLEPPHYHISSATTTLYPEEGWVIGYLGYLWLDGIPLVPVPVYLVDLSAYGMGQRADASGIMSLPEMGSNDEDGFYVLYKVPWIAGKKHSGRLVFLNTAKGGFGGGVEGNYIFDDCNNTNYRIYYDPRYNTYGGVTHTYSFGPPIGGRSLYLYNFFRIKQRLMFDLTTNVSYKERINFQQVSQLPVVKLTLNDVPVFFNHFNVGGSVSYGYITEETTGAGDTVGTLNGRGYFNIPTDLGRLSAGLGYNQSWYGLTRYWSRLTQNLGISRELGAGFDAYLGHMHYMNFEGLSPFAYEQYLTTPSDEFYSGLGYNFGQHRLSVDYSWYVPSWDEREFIYTLSLGFHCYAVEIKYNTAMQQVTFGVSLITR